MTNSSGFPNPRVLSTLLVCLCTALSTSTSYAQQWNAIVPKGRSLAPSSDQNQLVQRFVVRTKARGVGAELLLNTALKSAVARNQAGTLRSGRQHAVQSPPIVVQRKMAAEGWYVVKASRSLTSGAADSFMRELAADPDILSVEVDPLFKPIKTVSKAGADFVPNDPDYKRYQWNFYDELGGVRAEQAWSISTGQGVVVAVLDTGITKDTPDLMGNVLPGYDMISDKRISRRTSDGRAPGGWDIGSWQEENYCTGWASDGPHPPEASSWHGTHVAGTIAQETNNGKGLVGLAHGSKVVPVRVLGSCGGFGSDIADAMIWAAGGDVQGMPKNPNPAEVLNMSLGSSGPNKCPVFYQDAINKVNELGAVIVAAAGNDAGEAGEYTMSSCQGVISIGSTGLSATRASYSNYGARIDLAAPGGAGDTQSETAFIWQMINKGQKQPTSEWAYGGMVGTSMAAPHVSAAVALMQSVAETPLTVAQIRALLMATARPFPNRLDRPLGAGILDAYAASRAAKQFGKPIASLPLNLSETARPARLAAGSALIYSIEVPKGKSELNVLLYGGRGVLGAYLSFESEPFKAQNLAKSERPGTNQVLNLKGAAPGRYYLKIEAFTEVTGVNVRASAN